MKRIITTKSTGQTTTSSQGYVAILHAELAARASQDAKYSMRSFATDLGVESGALSRILSGQRPLSYKTALRMLDNLNFSDADRRDFLAAVEGHARALDQGERSPEQAERPLKAQAKKLETMSEAELRHVERVKSAKAKIDRFIVKDCKNHTLFVSTAVEGALVDQNFLASIETFLAKKKAELVITTSKAHLKALSDEEYPLDDIILDRYSDCVYKRVELNGCLSILDLDIRPYVTDPLAGLAELGAEDGRSYIFAHTQQRMKTYPNGMINNGAPRVQQCTGAMTLPLYRGNKAGLLADKRHVVGGLVVEVLEGHYHMRCVQADIDGSFVDMGIRYNPDGTCAYERAEAIIRGDDHVGFGDPRANKALDEATTYLQPRNIVVHDLNDAASVSHHRAHSIIARLEVPEAVKTLESELNECRKFLIGLNEKKPKDSTIMVIASNHNEHLHRYLNEGRYVDDIPNYKKGVELAYHYHCLGKDPLVQGVDPEQKLARWITRSNETIRVEGIAVNNHGDKGPNGSRGSVKGDAISYGRSSSGHSHSPEIRNGASRVGTTSILDMDYTSGSPSSWAHCFEIINKGKGGVGLRQLVIIVQGQWRMEEQKTKTSAKAKVNAKAKTKANAKRKSRAA